MKKKLEMNYKNVILSNIWEMKKLASLNIEEQERYHTVRLMLKEVEKELELFELKNTDRNWNDYSLAVKFGNRLIRLSHEIDCDTKQIKLAKTMRVYASNILLSHLADMNKNNIRQSKFLLL